VTPRQRFLAARAAYVAVVLLATLTDLEFSANLAAVGPRLLRSLSPAIGWRDAIDGLRNVALFAGLGTVWVVTSLTGKVRAEIRQAALVGFALSALVEGLQLFSPVRTASVVDLATNTLGAIAGAYGLALLIGGVSRAKGARSYLGVPAFLPAGAYALAVLSEAVTPLFRNAELPYTAGGPLSWLRSALWLSTPLTVGHVPLTDLLLYAPAGFLVAMTLIERGRASNSAWLLVAGIGAGFVFAAELAHGLIRLPISWEAALTHALALGVGAWAAHRWLAPLSRELRGPSRAQASLLAYGGILVLWGWRPFLPETSGGAIAAQFTARRFIPLQSLAGRVDVFSALHVAQQFALYVPLGCILAVWPLRLSGRWSHLWPAVGLAAVLEVGHVLVAGRFFDVTNAIIACAGLTIGWVLVRRAGFRPYGEALDL
jgi:glycopeptide antibiotics resistance protein